MIWECRLARPFSLNNAYVSGYDGKRYRSPKYTAWRKEAKREIMAQGRRPRFTEAEITIHVSSAALAAKQDLDNLAKPVLDVLVAMGVLPDDSWQVVRRVAVEVWLQTDENKALHPAPVCVAVRGVCAA